MLIDTLCTLTIACVDTALYALIAFAKHLVMGLI